MKEETPSFMSFERLLNDYLIENIDHIFFDTCENIGNLMHIDKSVQFLDGTKIEANVNKYTFVYKTRIVNADLFQRLADVKTFIPFMERYHEYRGEYSVYPMTDAGYGSHDHYMYCLTHRMELYMKYTMYTKKTQSKQKGEIK